MLVFSLYKFICSQTSDRYAIKYDNTLLLELMMQFVFRFANRVNRFRGLTKGDS